MPGVTGTAAPLLLILAHGIFGWGDDARSSTDGLTKAYFYGIAPFLKAYGAEKGYAVTVVAPTVPACDDVHVRGAALARGIRQAVETMPAGTRVHIIAHSMGGLDARWAIVAGGLDAQVASLTTLGTPHRGTTIGDLSLPLLPELSPPVKAVAAALDPLRSLPGAGSLEFADHVLQNIKQTDPDRLGRGVHALTLHGADDFNRAWAEAEEAIRARDRNRVVYVAYGGRFRRSPLGMLNPLRVLRIWPREDGCVALAPSRDTLATVGVQQERDSGNDGCVSVWSAHFPWDEPRGQWDVPTTYYAGTIPFDHVTMMNMMIPDQRPTDDLLGGLTPLYRKILDRIIQVQQAQ